VTRTPRPPTRATRRLLKRQAGKSDRRSIRSWAFSLDRSRQVGENPAYYSIQARRITLARRRRAPDQRKLRTREHVVAELAVNHIERQVLLCEWSLERVAGDYGIDLILFTYTVVSRET
jgi:hypothetical protein